MRKHILFAIASVVIAGFCCRAASAQLPGGLKIPKVGKPKPSPTPAAQPAPSNETRPAAQPQPAASDSDGRPQPGLQPAGVCGDYVPNIFLQGRE